MLSLESRHRRLRARAVLTVHIAAVIAQILEPLLQLLYFDADGVLLQDAGRGRGGGKGRILRDAHGARGDGGRGRNGRLALINVLILQGRNAHIQDGDDQQDDNRQPQVGCSAVFSHLLYSSFGMVKVPCQYTLMRGECQLSKVSSHCSTACALPKPMPRCTVSNKSSGRAERGISSWALSA